MNENERANGQVRSDDVVVKPKPIPPSAKERNRYMWLALRFGETAAQNHMMPHYVQRMDCEGRFSVSLETLIMESKLSRRSILRVNAELKETKVLTWKPGHGNRFNAPGEGQSNEYRIDLKRFQELAENTIKNYGVEHATVAPSTNLPVFTEVTETQGFGF